MHQVAMPCWHWSSDVAHAFPMLFPVASYASMYHLCVIYAPAPMLLLLCSCSYVASPMLLHHLCIICVPSLHHLGITCPSFVHHVCIIYAQSILSLHQVCIIHAPSMHRGIIYASPMHRLGIIQVPSRCHPCTSSASSTYRLCIIYVSYVQMLWSIH